MNYAFLFQLDENSGCCGSVNFLLTSTGKFEIAFYCFVTTDISTQVFQKVFLNSPLSATQILSVVKTGTLDGNDRILLVVAKQMLDFLLSHR